jgi:DNA replicative helicase MCM subunit Mcm2 (Cdc46/Mcm family)
MAVDLKKISENIKDKVVDASNIISDFKDESKEKIIGVVNNVGDLLPIIAETGYSLKQVEVEISIPPGIVLHFEKTKNISPEKIEEILEENKDKDLLKIIVKSLVSADELHKKIKLGNMVFRDIVIGLGIPPKVNICFVK